MPSDRLFGPSLTTVEMLAAVSDQAWLDAMLDVEAALARVAAALGLVSTEAATRIEEVCRRGGFDIDLIGTEAVAAANPVVPLVKEVRARLDGATRGAFHLGATSQDILDTAMMLVAQHGLDLLDAELDMIAHTCADLAHRHRDTLMMGRTLLQPAAPITFGLKAANWLLGIVEAASRLRELRSRLPVQLGGAAGTLAAFGTRGPEVARELARQLGLVEPVGPWHANRVLIAELGAGLAVAAGATAKIARDVLLLSQGEVGEVSAGGGRSSAMPHKRNPAGAVEALAAARLLEAQTIVLLRATDSEHERGAGPWQAEWPALSEAFRLAGGVVARTRSVLDRMTVDAERMLGNLQASRGLVMAESVAVALGTLIGVERARELVEAAAGRAIANRTYLRDELMQEDEVAGHAAQVDRALEPASYLGSTGTLIDGALQAHARRRT